MSDYPKIDMVIEYIQRHYPNHAERLAGNKLVATATMRPEYSNTQLEDIVDKIAMLNGISKE